LLDRGGGTDSPAPPPPRVRRRRPRALLAAAPARGVPAPRSARPARSFVSLHPVSPRHPRALVLRPARL